MRLSRLAAGLVTAGLVGFVPLAVTAPAQAAALNSVSTLTVDPSGTETGVFSIGDSLFFDGVVKGSDGTSTPTTGTVSLQVSTPAVPTFTTIATDDSPSFVSFSGVTAQTNATYKIVYAGGASGSGSTANTYTPSESAPVSIGVQRDVKLKTERLKVIGKVSPDFAKQKVKILAKKGKKYKKFASVKTDKKGRFTFGAPRRDKFKFAVVIPGDALYAPFADFYVVNIF